MINNKAQAMLITVLLLSGTILGASTIAGYLMFLRIQQATDFVNSSKAIFAADAGVEWELYKMFKDPDPPKPLFTNGAEIFSTSNSGGVIESIGRSLNVYRAFELRGTSSIPGG